MSNQSTPPDLELITIWERTTWSAGFLGDAIKARKHDARADVKKSLGEALILLTKSTAALQQLLAARP